MKNLIGLLSLFLIMTYMQSCKKDTNSSPNSTTSNSSQILGLWNLDKTHIVLYENGTKIKDTVQYLPAGYSYQYNFYSNSELAYYLNSNGSEQRDTLNYTLSNNELIIPGEPKLYVTKLTSNEFSFLFADSTVTSSNDIYIDSTTRHCVR